MANQQSVMQLQWLLRQAAGRARRLAGTIFKEEAQELLDYAREKERQADAMSRLVAVLPT